MGVFGALVPGRPGGPRAAALPAFVEAANHHAQAGELADALRIAHTKLHAPSPAPLFPAAVAADVVAGAVDSRLRQSFHQPQCGRSGQQPAGAAGGGQLLQHACRNALGRRQGCSHQRALGKRRRARPGGGVRLAIASDDPAHRGSVGVARRRAGHSAGRWPR